MPKPANKRSSKSVAAKPIIAKPAQPSLGGLERKNGTSSKQAVVIKMLRAPSGTTIGAMMQSTGWQQHSVRGFLAGVVRKRLKLRLVSEKVDGSRIYRINDRTKSTSSGSRSRRRAA